MSDKNVDILEKSILDAKKVKALALQSAERVLKRKYSQDLKKLYVKNLNEEFDFDISDEPGILGEEDFNPEEDFGNEMDENDPSFNPEREGSPEGMGDLGGLEGDMGGGLDGDAMSPPNMPEAGGGPNPSDQGAAVSPNDAIGPELSPQIPNAHDEIVLSDPDQQYDIDLGTLLQNIENETEDLLGNSGNPDMMPDENDQFDDQNYEEMEFREEDQQYDDQYGNNQYEDEENQYDNQYEEEPFNQNRGMDFASIQLDDNVLLEYIESSLKNDEIIKKLKKDLEEITTQVLDLTKALNESNNNLDSLKTQNVRLMYQNQSLIDDSLSEHQKRHIVQALNKAETVNEAKAIYESAKMVTTKTVDPSKNVINKILSSNSTSTLNTLRENRDANMLPQANRWQELAGIKKIR